MEGLIVVIMLIIAAIIVWRTKKKSVLRKMGGSVEDLAREYLTAYDSIRDANPSLPRLEQYRACVLQVFSDRVFSEEHGGSADLNALTDRIMSGAAKGAQTKDEPLRFQHVVHQAVVIQMSFKLGKPVSSPIEVLTAFNVVSEVIPSDM